MTKEKKKPDYRLGYKYLLNHIEELNERLDEKDNLVDIVIEDFIDFRIDIGEDERTATRKVYKRIYDDKWKNHIDGKFLTKEESQEWFDDNHDDWFCSGDHIANSNYIDLAQYETGIHNQFINGKIVKAYNHPQLNFEFKNQKGGVYETNY
jgi:hypothetical protein